MHRLLASLVLLIARDAAAFPVSAAREEQTLVVPGFADFLAVDGDTVWATNKGRVERWSRRGLVATVPMSHPCGAMALGFGALWVADCQEGTLVRIDPRTARIVARVATGIANPKGELNVVASPESVWVASDDAGRIAKVDPATNRVVATVAVDAGSYYLAFGFGSLWAVSSASRSLQKIDPATNAVVKRIALGRQPGFLAAGEDAVWVQEQGDGTVARVDAATGAVSGRVKVGRDLLYGDIDAAGGAVWLRTTADQTFVVIDPQSLRIVARVGKPSGSGALRYAGSGLWTTAHDLHTLTWWSTTPAERP
ncbi:YncE family protein [Sphingomonas sp.]|uniref:Vgb family protein n=1 Tax=Sphingomonas sp. TaxID=28214 RepID=UPI003B005D91